MDSTVASLFEVYLARSDLRPASVRFKRKAHNYFLRWFGDMPVTEIRRSVIEDYKNLLSKGRKKRSANGYFANYRPFFNWLFANGKILSNPFEGIRLYRITESRRQTFSAYELSRLIQTASRLWRVRICMGLLGMRRGEVLNLTVREINQSGRDSHILLQPKKKTATTWPWGIKDHAVRMIALPEYMRFAGYDVYLHRDLVRLQEDLEVQPYVCLEKKYYDKLIGWQDEGILTDKEISDPTGNFQRFFRQLQQRAGIRELKRFHELRAAFATKMIAKQGLERAADALGHSSVEITRRYDRRTETELVADIGRMAEFFYQT
jgi:integrase